MMDGSVAVPRCASRTIRSIELVESPEAYGPSASESSAMFEKRSSRDFAKQRITACSSASGKSGRYVWSGTGESAATIASSAGADSASNGATPASSSYKMAPSA